MSADEFALDALLAEARARSGGSTTSVPAIFARACGYWPTP